METLINLYVPEDQQIPISMDGIVEVGPYIWNYNYKSYLSYELALRAKIAEDVHNYDHEDPIDHNKIMGTINMVLNPPSDFRFEEGQVFDIDLKPLEHDHQSHNGYYIPKDMYQHSCPHLDPSHDRVVRHGFISCYLTSLMAHARIIKWYGNNRHKNMPHEIKDVYPILTVGAANDLNSYGKLIQRIFKTDFQHPQQLIDNYNMGTANKLHLKHFN